MIAGRASSSRRFFSREIYNIEYNFVSLPSASPPALERWPQGSLMCTLGGSPREKQKRKEGEEEA